MSSEQTNGRDELILTVRDVDADYHGTGPLALSGAEAALIADAVIAAGWRKTETHLRPAKRLRHRIAQRIGLEVGTVGECRLWRAVEPEIESLRSDLAEAIEDRDQGICDHCAEMSEQITQQTIEIMRLKRNGGY